MNQVPIQFAGAEGNRLAGDLFEAGGHPVILIHGGGQTRRAWDGTAIRLVRSGLSAITYDQRGHGESAWVESGLYGFGDFADDLIPVARDIAARFGELPTVVGASLGGLSALGAEMKAGPLFRAIVLVDVTPRMDPDGVFRVLEFMQSNMAEGFATLEEVADAVAGYMPHRKRPSSLDGLRKNLRLDRDGRFRWHWDPALVAGDNNIRENGVERMQALMDGLDRLTLPILLVRGMQSELVREEHAREFVDAAPNARVIDVSGAGHMVAGDRNDVFSDAVLRFLEETAPA
jgi:pimeloyl-ACP methyl ester carboxylesterase